jgi:hypothetical protein
MIAGLGRTREGVAASAVSETPSSVAPVRVIAAFVGTFGPVGSSIAEATTNNTSRPAKTVGVPQRLILTTFISMYVSQVLVLGEEPDWVHSRHKVRLSWHAKEGTLAQSLTG